MGQVKRMVTLRPGLPQIDDLLTRLDMALPSEKGFLPLTGLPSPSVAVFWGGFKRRVPPQNMVTRGGEAYCRVQVTVYLSQRESGEG
jgi:hypothetical protein